MTGWSIILRIIIRLLSSFIEQPDTAVILENNILEERENERGNDHGP